MITKDGYVFAYDADSRTVTVTKSVRNGASFADAVDEAKRLLSYFRGQEGSKVVGCTGIGFDLQRKIGVVRINKTEVTLKKCQAGMIALRERNSRWTR